jgi:hypothetical protein
MFTRLEEKARKLAELKTLHGVENLDLSGYGFVAGDVSIICEVLARCPDITTLNLANNDFRNIGVEKILQQSLQANKNLKVLDIVDNNLERDFIGTHVAPLIAKTALQEIYIGARNIANTPKCRHIYRIKGVHYCDDVGEHGFYGTGFNEVAGDDIPHVAKALEARKQAGNLIRVCYFTSWDRSYRASPIFDKKDIDSRGLDALAEEWRAKRNYEYDKPTYLRDMCHDEGNIYNRNI